MNMLEFLTRVATDERENPAKRRIAQHLIAETGPSSQAPIVGGQYNAPVIGIPARVVGAAFNGLGLAMEPFDEASKAATGGAEALVGKFVEQAFAGRAGYADAADVRQRNADLPWMQALTGYEQAQGNPIQRARQANEAGAAGHEVLQGLVNAGLNPLNFVGGLGEAAQASNLPRVAKALKVADVAQNLPFEALGAAVRGGKAARFASKVGDLPIELLQKTAKEGKGLESRIAARRLVRLAEQGPDHLPPMGDLPPVSPAIMPKPGTTVPMLRPPANPNPIADRLKTMFPGEYPAPPTLPDAGGDSGIIRRTITPPPLPARERMAQRLATLFPGEFPAPPTTAIGGDSGPIRRLVGNPMTHLPAQSPATLGNAAAGGALRGELGDAAMRLNLGLPPRVPTPPAGGGGVPAALALSALRMGAGGASDLEGAASRAAAPAGQPVATALVQAMTRSARNLAGEGTREAEPVARQAVGALPPSRNPITIAQRARMGMPPEAIGLAEERAARAVPDLIDNAAPPALAGDFPKLGNTRPEALAQLSGDELDTLLGIAYPGDNALGNAIAKYPHPVDLTEAAIKRITGDNRLVARLSGVDDDLARKLAFLPDLGEQAASTLLSPLTNNVDQVGAAVDDTVRTIAGGGGLRNGESALYDRAGNRLDLGERAPLGGAADDEAARLADEAAMYDDQRLQVIENSPYFAAFQYFNPRGDLKATNPITGQRIINRVGGKFGTFREGVGNITGNGYDELAANLLDAYQGGHNQNYGQTAEDFWTEAQQAYKEYRALTRPRSSSLSYGGDMAAGGMGLLPFAGGLSGAVGRAVLPAVGGGLAGAGAGGIYGVTQGNTPGEHLQNALKYAVLGGGAGALAGAGGSMASLSPEARHILATSGKGAIAGAAPGALTGGIYGALHGSTEGDTPEERWRNAGKGAITGAASGALGGALMGGTGGALVGHNTSEAAMRQVARTSDELAVAAQGRAQALSKSQPWLKSVGQFWKVAKADIVQHPKNLLNDETFGSVVTLAMEGRDTLDRVKPIRDELAARMKETDPWAAQPSTTQARLDGIGRSGYVAQIGTSLIASEKALADELSAAQTMQASTLASLLAPGGANVLGVAFGAAKGRFAAYRDTFFRAMNSVGNNSFRYATFDQELDTGLRVADAMLRRKHSIAANALPSGGNFTPADVAKVVGHQAARDWQAYTDTVIDSAEGRAKFLFGDYGTKSWLEQKLGGAVPFASWSIRAYPVALAMAKQHPALALAAIELLRATSKGAGEDGRPGYTAGMIPIPSDTPLLGPIIAALTGGQANITYVDPIGAFSPVGGELFQPAEEGKRSAYQQASDTLGRVGLPGFNPAIKLGAETLGLDYKDVGSFSRTQGIESALALVPGNKQLPDISGAIQRTLRGAVSPRFAATGIGQALGAEGDDSPTAYDAVTRRYAELVYEKTGKTLVNPANADFLAGLARQDNPLLLQARMEVLAGGGLRNAVGLANPVNTVSQTDTARAAKAAKQGEPFTYDEIEAKKAVSPTLAAAMQTRVDQYRKANPIATVYQVANRGAVPYEQLRAWEKANTDFRFVVGETAYQRALKQKKIELGLLKPEPATR